MTDTENNLKPTWPTETFSSVIYLYAISPGFWRFKQCMQRTVSLSKEWNTISLSPSRQGLKVCGSLSSVFQCLLFSTGVSRLNELHNSEEILSYSLAACTVTSCGTAHWSKPWQDSQTTWPWAGFVAQPKWTWLLLSFSSASHTSHVFSGSRCLQCPDLIKPKGGLKPHRLILDQDSDFQACLSPKFLLFGLT